MRKSTVYIWVLCIGLSLTLSSCAKVQEIESFEDLEREIFASISFDWWKWGKEDELEVKDDTVLLYQSPFLQGLTEREIASVMDESMRFYGKDIKTIFSRSRFSRQLVQEALTEVRAPLDMQVVPMVESGYNPYAYSSVGAAGLWQLMPATASYLHVQTDADINGRRDVKTSTRAAALYLKALKKRFKYWPLAFAAYHLGPTSVYKRIRKRPWSPKDGLRNLPLPPVTKMYIRHVLGLTALLETGRLQFPSAYMVKTLNVRSPADLGNMVQHMRWSESLFFRYNPQLQFGQYFKRKEALEIYVPDNKYKSLLHEEQTRSHQELILLIDRYGLTLRDMGKKYGLSVRQLLVANPGMKTHLKKGDVLHLPYALLERARARKNILVNMR